MKNTELRARIKEASFMYVEGNQFAKKIICEA